MQTPLKESCNKLIARIEAPVPKFFRRLRRVGLMLTAIGAALIGAPIGLPMMISEAAGYITVAGSVITAMSQLTTCEETQ
jgi:hypothetical protein